MSYDLLSGEIHDKNLEKRIEELEKKVKELELIQKFIVETDPITIQEEITALKEQLMKLDSRGENSKTPEFKPFECPICNTYVYWKYKTDYVAVKRKERIK